MLLLLLDTAVAVAGGVGENIGQRQTTQTTTALLSLTHTEDTNKDMVDIRAVDNPSQQQQQQQQQAPADEEDEDEI